MKELHTAVYAAIGAHHCLKPMQLGVCGPADVYAVCCQHDGGVCSERTVAGDDCLYFIQEDVVGSDAGTSPFTVMQ